MTTTIESEFHTMTSTTTPDDQYALSDAELDAAVDELHAPCLEAIRSLVEGIDKVTQPGTLLLGPESAGLLLSALAKAYARSAFIASELGAMEFSGVKFSGSVAHDARVLRDSLDLLRGIGTPYRPNVSG